MKKRILSVFLMLTMAVVFTGLAGCQKSEEKDSEDTKQEEAETDEKIDFGIIKVGMDGAHAPYCAVNEESGELEGFEVDVMNCLLYTSRK